MGIQFSRIETPLTVGGSGTASATANSSNVISGIIRGIHIEYVGTPPNTTDVTIAGITPPSQPILTVSNNATSGWFYPKALAIETDGSTISGGWYTDIVVNDKVSVSVAQANDDDSVIVTILYSQV